MSRFLCIAVLCALPFLAAWRQYTIPQATGATATASSGGITSGDLIACEYGIQSGATVSSFTDSLNASGYSLAVAHTFGAPFSWNYGIEYFANSAHGSTDTITLTNTSATQFMGMACQAYKNVATSSPLDTNGTNNPGSAGITTGTNPTSGNFQTTQNGELVLGQLATQSVTPTAGNGTLIDSIPGEFQWPEYYVQATASASTTLTYTMSSDSWGMVWASFISNGGTVALDGTCHSSTDNGATSSLTIVVTISC